MGHILGVCEKLCDRLALRTRKNNLSNTLNQTHLRHNFFELRQGYMSLSKSAPKPVRFLDLQGLEL